MFIFSIFEPNDAYKKNAYNKTVCMCAEIATFYVDNATKNYKNIKDLDSFKGSWMGYNKGAA